MKLRRIGNKSKIASKILNYFPKHDLYIELFFGAGGLFFNKEPMANYNIMNDIDDDVYNFYTVFQNDSVQLIKEFELCPINQTLFNFWVKNKEIEPIKKALRFVYLSNYSYLGSSDCLKFGFQNAKKMTLSDSTNIFNKIKNVQFMNKDFRKVIKSVGIRNNDLVSDTNRIFIYADPPYLNTGDNYTQSFNLNDTIDLFDIAKNCGIKMAISEFKNDVILDIAKQHNFNIVEIVERKTLKSRNTEILITNYELDGGFF